MAKLDTSDPAARPTIVQGLVEAGAARLSNRLPAFSPLPVSPKIVVRDDADTVFVISRKRHAKGAVLFELKRNNDTSPSVSVGGTFQFYRIQKMNNVLDGWVRKKTASAVSGTWTSSTALGLTSHGYSGATGGVALDYRSTATNGDYAEYSVTCGPDGKFTLGFLMSSATVTRADVSIPADATCFPAQAVNMRRTGSVNVIAVREFQYKPGTHTVRIAHAGTGGDLLAVFGVNMRSILSTSAVNQDPGTFDSWAYVRNDDYYSASAGANDYAIREANTNLLGGSYHGAETQNVDPVFVGDGAAVTLSTGVPVLVRELLCIQDTQITWPNAVTVRARSTQVFEGDGSHLIRADLLGPVLADLCVTGMCTSYATQASGSLTGGFSEMEFPIKTADVLGRWGYPRGNRYIQRNPATEQRIMHEVTLFDNDFANAYGGPHVWPSAAGPYYKFYNAPAQDGVAVTIDRLQFEYRKTLY